MQTIIDVLLPFSAMNNVRSVHVLFTINNVRPVIFKYFINLLYWPPRVGFKKPDISPLQKDSKLTYTSTLPLHTNLPVRLVELSDELVLDI